MAAQSGCKVGQRAALSLDSLVASPANGLMVDGSYNLDVGSNGTQLVNPSIDSIQEVKISTNSYHLAVWGSLSLAPVPIKRPYLLHFIHLISLLSGIELE